MKIRKILFLFHGKITEVKNVERAFSSLILSYLLPIRVIFLKS